MYRGTKMKMTMDVTGINTSQKTVEKLLYSIERKKKLN